MIIEGDSLEELKKLATDSIDFICTDPPYGYSFMGKHWDKAVPSMQLWMECLRVLKPGGFINVMSAPRSDVLSRMIVNIEDAGFRVNFTPLFWTMASGFPKAMNVYKKTGDEKLKGAYGGFQPKPAVEVIIVAMKPLSQKTFVDQALDNGKGISWLDDGRIPTDNKDWDKMMEKRQSFANGDKNGTSLIYGKHSIELGETTINPQGRFPANLLISDDVLNDGVMTKGSDRPRNNQQGNTMDVYGTYQPVQSSGFADSGSYSRYFNLDKWAQTLPFLIVPKASKSEKNKGLPPELKASHPTVKPLKLMSYLITLFSREGDVVLDPFCGSGTTCVAAKKLNRQYIGIEREAEYIEIANARLVERQASLL